MSSFLMRSTCTSKNSISTNRGGRKLKKELKLAVEAVRDKKAYDLVILNLKNICNFADYFLICHGTSTRQVQAICDSIEEKLYTSNIRCNHIEGKQDGHWVLMDYSDFIVHIFTKEHRDFYNLERLWGDAKRVPIPPEEIRPLKPKKLKGAKSKKSSRK